MTTEMKHHKQPSGDHSSDLELRELNNITDVEEKETACNVTDSLLGHQTPHTASSTDAPHPLFPPLPSYGPPSLTANIQYMLVRCVSFFLSLVFLGAVVAGALIQGVTGILTGLRLRASGQDPNVRRIFHVEEQERQRERDKAYRSWKRRQRKNEVDEEVPDECPPLEGGQDPVVCDVAYYARRVGLDIETFKVQTEDNFILTLWHVYNPQEYTPLSAQARRYRGPEVFADRKDPASHPDSNRKYPVLLIHGLLQSAGAYCVNDDDSLAFYLAKSGYDVWLGNNRCALRPEHTTLSPSDPRMWSWNLQQMGTLDVSALVSRVLYETGFDKLGLVCHSQGTAQTLVALSRDQRPELGERISVFCALAPAAYAGPLVERAYFRFMRVISPSIFYAIFGIHSFIPFMITMHDCLPGNIYGTMGYYVFSFLFNWSDTRWDRGLRDRMFQFAPVYVSTETMRWWLGRECFATQKCILSTHEVGLAEIEEDHRVERGVADADSRSDTAWFGPQAPPMALWIAGSDDLVDGRRLLRRLRNGREPHVNVVHAKVIEEYEHLDVLWAMDSVDQVGQEIRQVLWSTMPETARAVCRVPAGVR
ncbi:putative ab-hydrolase associated lipase [Aspergillus candidus]|uniref:Lipase n=1 Tax=Aspergillus candidus TaxID=41067 RepID=A0A2I2FE27_ASPCN|nr:lipase [Aspergillus candidus]PLB38878.1 lipase [Aspergillus candidus]